MSNKNNERVGAKSKRILTLVLSMLIAVALCVTCILFFNSSKTVPTDNDSDISVDQSATYTDRTGNLTGAGVLVNNDILNYNYKGTIVNVTLPRGTYTFEVWGAEGGGRRLSGNSSSGYGGYGGYAKGTVTITANTTYYIVVGGYGSWSTYGNAAGGYNGGGQGYASSSSEPGNGGGGATHIATRSGLLNALNSYRSDVKIVAGGGGGGGEDSGDQYGHGGGTTGTSNYYPGTQTAAGSGGGFGYGGGTNYGDGGGGGGGWFGGGTTRTSSRGGDTQGGGGGSGYVGGVSGGTMSTGVRTGHGYARITCVQVNQVPVTRSATIAGAARGTCSIAINASTIASDPEGTAVYFSNGTSSNYDTYTSAGLWLNSACTTSASNYLNWSYTNSGTITVTSIKRYPRSGVDGCTSNGRLTLYTRVRDNFGTNTQRGVSVIVFYLTVTDNAPAMKTGSTGGQNYLEYSYGGSDVSTNYKYRVGKSTSTDTTYDYNSGTGIYNTSTNINTVFLPTPLTTNRTSGFTVYAADLFADADSAYDVVGIKTVSSSNYTSYYTVTYNANSTKYGSSGLNESITIKPTTLKPASTVFVALTLTLQSCESASKAAIGSTPTISFVFKLANTRPYYASSSVLNTGLNEPSVTLTAGGYADIKITDFLKDPDGTTPKFVTSADAVKVPTNEYISVTRENTVLGLKSTSNYYNKTSAAATSWQTGEGTTATGFKSRVLAAYGSATANTACVSYQFINNTTLRIYGKAATQYMYSSGSGRTGDFYIMVRVSDEGDLSDSGIWYPIAIKVNSTAPTEPSITANFDLSFTYSQGTAIADASSTSNGIYITPVSYADASGTLMGVGASSNGNALAQASQVSPFVTDADNFSYGSGETTDACTFELNDIVALSGNTVGNGASYTVNTYQTNPFFAVEVVDLYAASSVFNNLTSAQKTALGISQQNDKISSFKGIKITPLRSTGGYYYEIDVKVVDTYGKNSTVKVLIKVDNRAASIRRDDLSTNYPFNKAGGVGAYTTNAVLNASYMQYSIKKNDVLYVTPYDLVYDLDSACVRYDYETNATEKNGTVVVHNNFTNPADTGFADTVNDINKTYTVKRTEMPSVAPTQSSVTLNKLDFVNADNITSTAAQYSSYFNTEVVTSIASNGGTYVMPALKITANSRTTTNVLTIRFSVTDGYNAVDCIIAVRVENSAPVLNSELESCCTLKAGNLNSFKEYTVATLATDIDGDTPTFFGEVKAVAKVGDEYYEALNAEFEGVSKNDPSAKYILSDYFSAKITKGETSATSGVDVIRIDALSSTQLFACPIYIEFRVTDGYRLDPLTSTLHLQVEVENSVSQMVTDGLSVDNEGHYDWKVKYENMAEKGLARYLVNDSELYASTAIAASPSNKILLFNDVDSQQHVLLNPYNGFIASGNYAAPLVGKISGNIEESNFTQNQNAAVLYSKTYPNTKSEYLTLSVLFFEKNADGTFTRLVDTDDKIKTAQYWAIEIKDTSTENSTGQMTQIAIAIKDDHHNADVYSGNRAEGAQKGNTAVTVLNFRFGYHGLGITSMHEYYRTDGNSESTTKIGEASSTDYTVDIDKLYDYQFTGGKPSVQDDLLTAQFSNDFMYQYFVNVKYVDGESKLTPKTYAGQPTNTFYYKPVEVPAEGSIDMPISYIAMPQAYANAGTEGDATHVMFANAVLTGVSDSNTLVDSAYASWNTPAQLAKIFENLELTDGTKTWKGNTLNDNPYITVAYNGTVPLTCSLVNSKRAQLNDIGDYSIIPESEWISGTGDSRTSNFREDKYGFTFTKKDGGERTVSSLKLYVNLKTSSENSEAQKVGVDINLLNSRPTDIKYKNSAQNLFADISVNMTMGDTQGKSVVLTRADAGYVGDGEIITYTDPDKTDVLKFNLATGSNAALSTVLSAADIAHTSFKGNYLFDTSVLKYYDVEDEAALKSIDCAAYVPNPGYEYFFDVSPATGSSSVIQFIPKAKTALNGMDGNADSTAIIAANHLKSDANGVYYPYRILFYDDLNNSGMTNGFLMTAIIKVYISNDKLSYTINDSSSYYDATTDTRYQNDYNITLTKGVSYTIDVSSFLADNDIVLQGASLATDKDLAWTDIVPENSLDPSNNVVASNPTLVKDYLIMPVNSSGGVEYTKLAPQSGTSVNVTVSANSKTTLVFETDSAFKTQVALLMEFKDSAYSRPEDIVKVVFVLNYTNESPSANADTFDGASTLSITMKTNDSFTLHSADTTEFVNDKKGGYSSPEAFNSAVIGGNIKNYPTSNAATLKSVFKQRSAADVNDNGIVDGNLGDLIIAQDDAPSTLRFVENSQNQVKVGEFAVSSNASNFTVTPSNRLRYENNIAGSTGNSHPMSVKITALGVVTNAIYYVTLSDGSLTVRLTLSITVLSTAPAISTSLPDGMTRVTEAGVINTYSINIKYGDTFKVALNSLVTDIDKNDNLKLNVPAIYDGSQFKIVNPEGVSVVNAEQVPVNTINYLHITATDYVPTSGEYATVTFRVADPYGAQSEEITIRVIVEPRTLTLTATTTNAAKVELKSVTDYYTDGATQILTLVADSNKGVVSYDLDVNAASALYDVSLFALLKKNDNGTFSEITAQALDTASNSPNLIAARTQAHGNNGAIDSRGNGEIYTYVTQFFTVEISADGKTLEFTPNAATLGSAAAIAPIKLYAVISKNYTTTGEGGNNNYVMSPIGASINVSVKNSAPVATQSTAVNFGYPYKNNAARSEDYLSFTGYAGDELTWDLYNTEDDREQKLNFGLFYDYDMVNASNTTESLTYLGCSVDARYDGKDVPRDALNLTSNDPVLSITCSDDGKHIKIKINRKVQISQPGNEGVAAYTDIPVRITCGDKIAYGASDRTGLTASTVIVVRVQNDPPEFKKTVDSSLRYTVSYSESTGYTLNAKIKTNQTLTVKFADIIDDADINMDAYFLNNSGDTRCLTSNSGDIKSIAADEAVLFKYNTNVAINKYNISTITSITFTCVSPARNAVANCILQLQDSTRSTTTSRLSIYLTVENTAPVAEDDVTITVIGTPIVEGGEDDGDMEMAFTDNILNYVTDINPGDAVDAFNSDSNTYVFVDNIVMRTTESEVDQPIIYGPAWDKYQNSLEDEDSRVEAITSVCSVIWSEEEHHQSFGIVLTPGLYGTQYVVLNVIDSGYIDGAIDFVDDGLLTQIKVKIIVTRPVDDMELPSFDIANRVTRKVTPELLLNSEGNDTNAVGYRITNITTNSDSLTVASNPVATTSSIGVSESAIAASDAETEWFITAGRIDSSAVINVTFAIGNTTVSHDFAINITANSSPVLKTDANLGVFTKDQLNESNMITITPQMWFDDPDIDDVMRFVAPVKTKVSAYVEAHLDGNNIVLSFKGRGTTDLTLNITDATGALYSHTIQISCTDIAELSWFNAIMAQIQSNPMMYGLIAGGALLLIIALIIILVVVHKRKKMRLEIEALLSSEAELDEEMLRLSSGAGATQYQSFGYLPPTSQITSDIGLMIGNGQTTQVPQNMQLNAGYATVEPKTVPGPNSQPGVVNSQPGATTNTGTTGPNGKTAQTSAAPVDDFDPDSF